MYKILFIAFVFLFVSCSGISILNQEDTLSKDFEKKIEGIQRIYKDGLRSEALDKLTQIPDNSITAVEKAKKYNFIGIIKYSNNDLDLAIKNFEIANNFEHSNSLLNNQVLLNIASCFYRLDQAEYSSKYISQINPEYFSSQENIKYNTLRLTLARRSDNNKEIVDASLNLGKELQSFSDVESFSYLSVLKKSFSRLSESEKVYSLESNNTNILAAYLAKDEAFAKMAKGDKSSISNIIDWLEDNFSHIPEIAKVIHNYESNLEHYSKIDSLAIGVIIPMSGQMKKFGDKALMGVESALSYSKNKSKPSTIFTKDSGHNPAIAAKAVRELIEKNKVSVIVGGLFPKTAAAEYLECRKYGVLFISLSSVNISKLNKSHLLIELPGSIQSQIHDITDKKFLDKVGYKVAVMYPDNNNGRSYVDELWSLHESGLIQITSINAYDDKLKDFREPISKLLGLKYKRERSEELKLWKEIYAAESKRSIRRKQYLKPVIDFDWVFIPALPQDAVQIIPTFSYFDVKQTNMVGIPSWNARRLVRSDQRYNQLYFVGDDAKDYDLSFKTEFKKRNGVSPRLVEILSFEAMDMALKLSHGLKYTNREEFASGLYAQKKIEGLTGNWELTGNLWLKRMDYLKISARKVMKVDFSAN